MSEPDIWFLYELMLESRCFEREVNKLWDAGLISGEMHPGIGEEAIAAGVVSQLKEGDAMALDHRGTAPLLMRGVDPVLLLKEFLGRDDGLCHGKGGHMHLFSKEHLSASSGIVGASGPSAAGFALAAKTLRPGHVAVSFSGEGSYNQGMMMEAMNLASIWKLPVLFICKNNGWSISTRSAPVTAGNLVDRARSFAMPAEEVDGVDVLEVWRAAQKALVIARNGDGPSFIMARCAHPEGHFLGDPLVRIAHKPVKGMAPLAGPLAKALFSGKGTSAKNRIKSIGTITSLIKQTVKERFAKGQDPLEAARLQLEAGQRLELLEKEVRARIEKIVLAAVALNGSAGEHEGNEPVGENGGES